MTARLQGNRETDRKRCCGGSREEKESRQVRERETSVSPCHLPFQQFALLWTAKRLWSRFEGGGNKRVKHFRKQIYLLYFWQRDQICLGLCNTWQIFLQRWIRNISFWTNHMWTFDILKFARQTVSSHVKSALRFGESLSEEKLFVEWTLNKQVFSCNT